METREQNESRVPFNELSQQRSSLTFWKNISSVKRSYERLVPTNRPRISLNGRQLKSHRGYLIENTHPKSRTCARREI